MGRILIIGTGAATIPLGYALAVKGKHEVSFLVRDCSRESKKDTWTLFWFDVDKLVEFSQFTYVTKRDISITDSYEVVVCGLPLDVVLSEEGQELLSYLGERLRNAVFLALQPARDVVSHYLAAGIKRSQVVSGAFTLLSVPGNHALFPRMISSPNPDVLKADFAFKFLNSVNRPIMLSSKPSVGVSMVLQTFAHWRIQPTIVPSSFFQSFSCVLFPYFLALELNGWKKLHMFGSHGAMAAAAVRDMLVLHGWTGWFMSFFFFSPTIYLMQAINESGSKPFHSVEFTRFHHASKVQQQNLLVLEDYQQWGHHLGKPMASLGKLLKKIKHHRTHVHEHQ